MLPQYSSWCLVVVVQVTTLGRCSTQHTAIGGRWWGCVHPLLYSRNTTQMSWTDSTLFLQVLVVEFCTFLWSSYQVSGRTSCKHVALSTHPFHNMMEGQAQLPTHSRLSQVATSSSGMWRQEMLPSILHGFHFDTISSFSFQYFVPDIFDQTS
jgi:hypothetical protein